MVEVRLLGGVLRGLLGGARLRVPAAGVEELLQELVARAGPELARRLYEDPAAPEPRLHRDLRVLVNGRDQLFLRGLATRLAETDTVTLHLAGSRAFPGG